MDKHSGSWAGVRMLEGEGYHRQGVGRHCKVQLDEKAAGTGTTFNFPMTFPLILLTGSRQKTLENTII